MNTPVNMPYCRLPEVMGRMRRVHFVGIGGVGMSGIAEVLVNLEFQVSGSDVRESATTQRLAKLGAEICIGHRAANVKDRDVVVTSSAVKDDNPEVVMARELRIPVVPRAEMLAREARQLPRRRGPHHADVIG